MAVVAVGVVAVVAVVAVVLQQEREIVDSLARARAFVPVKVNNLISESDFSHIHFASERARS